MAQRKCDDASATPRKASYPFIRLRMSLEVLNSPPLVGGLTLGCYGALPLALGYFSSASIPWTVVKGVNLAVYGLSVWSVSQPGRYDGQIRQESSQDDPKRESTGMEKMGTGRRGRTLVPPAGWAFAIWGPVFLGEFLITTSQLRLPQSSDLAPLIREVTGPFVMAQTFQSLWTASFRPKYDHPVYKYISFLNLSGIAISLSFCHSAFSKARDVPLGVYLLNFFPLSLHFGWTTAAALVNLNGMFVLGNEAKARAVAILGHASVIAATAVGVSITLARRAPVYGGVIAWALSAVASGLSRRIVETANEDQNAVGVFGAKLQRSLSILGAVLCVGASVFVSFRS